ncbi:MAG: PKD domain-containing protein [Saprospiraceae bacterium]
MRRFLFTLSFLFTFGYLSYGQLPNGSDAPDWTLVDLNGETHNLYSYLDNGVDVIIDFSATWCGPCWSYHSSHILNNYYNAHGPNGTGDVMVFFIESDLNTNENCLYGQSGCNGTSQGNWVSGTNYPIINLTSSNGPGVGGEYQIAFYPTIYMISSKNKKVYRDGQPSAATLDTWIYGSFDMDATADVTNATCGGDGSVNQTVTAGFGNKTYSWNSGQSSQDITNLSPGVYNCQITDAHGYTLQTDDFVVDGILVPLFYNATEVDEPTCFGGSDGSITVEGLFGNGGYSYEWDNGETSNTITNLESRLYFVTVTDSGNCSYEGEVDLGQPSEVTATASAPTIPCGQSFGTITVSGSGGAGGFSYDIGFGPQSSGTFSNLSPGTYTYLAFDENGCESTSAEIILNIESAPAAAAVSSGELTCSTNQVTVSGVGSATGSNISYAWSTTNGTIVSGQNAIDAVVSAAGTYTLLVTDTQTGCQSTVSTTVNSNTAQPSISVSNGQLTCSVNSIEICANTDAGLTPTWSINGQQINADCATVTSAGTYTATVIGTNGCQNTAQSTVIASTDLPEVSITAPSQLTCTTTEITLSGTVNGDPSQYSISWATSDGNIVSGQNTLNPIVSEPGNYTMTVINNNTNCSATSTTSVSQFINNPNGAFTFNQNGAIFNGEATSSDSGNTYAWDFGNGETSTEAQVSYAFSVPGTYNICLSVTNECGTNTTCSSFTYTATLALTPSVTASTCHDSNDGAISINITGGNPNYSIAWTGPNGFTSQETSISNLAPGMYNVVVTDAVGYQITESFEITAPAPITDSDVVIVSDTDGKQTGSVSVNISGGNGNYTFLWSNGSTGDGLLNVGEGSYTLQVTDNKGCTQTFGPYVVGNIVAVDETKIVQQFTLSPNPTSTYLQINVTLVNPSEGQMTINNSLGKRVSSYQFLGNISEKIDVSGMTDGVYYLNIQTKDGDVTKRFMVLH